MLPRSPLPPPLFPNTGVATMAVTMVLTETMVDSVDSLVKTTVRQTMVIVAVAGLLAVTVVGVTPAMAAGVMAVATLPAAATLAATAATRAVTVVAVSIAVTVMACQLLALMDLVIQDSLPWVPAVNLAPLLALHLAALTDPTVVLTVASLLSVPAVVSLP